MFTYETLLKFAADNNLLDKPFSEVIQLYKKEMDEIWEDMQADYWIDQAKSFMI